MSSNNRTELKANETQVIAGLQKYAATITSLIVLGKTVTVAQAIAILQARIAAITAAQAAKVVWLETVAQQNQQLASTDAFVDSLVTVIRGMYASSPTTLADFGQTPKKTTTLTVEQKQLASLKRAATREARHTMSKKQKAAIKGTVPAASTTATAQPSVASTASSSGGTTSGGTGTSHS